MNTVPVPFSLVMDRRAPGNLVHVAAFLATAVDADGCARIAQASIASYLSIAQEEVVGLLHYLRDRNYINVIDGPEGVAYRLLWIPARKAAAPTRYQWAQVIDRIRNRTAYIRLQDPPESHDELRAYLEGLGLDLLRLVTPQVAKARS